MGTALEGIKAVFLDLDGTIYLGGDLIDGALDFLQRCDDQGVKRYFLSNNSSRSVDHTSRSWRKWGFLQHRMMSYSRPMIALRG